MATVSEASVLKRVWMLDDDELEAEESRLSLLSTPTAEETARLTTVRQEKQHREPVKKVLSLWYQ